MTILHCRPALCALLALGLVSCMGQGHGRMPFNGSPVQRAEPAALFLAGLDTNLDGVVTEAELEAAVPKLWASADANGDGEVSLIELNTWRVHWFGSADGWPGRFTFDTSGDGHVSRGEFEAGLKSIFADYDKQKNGRIARASLLTSQSRGSRPRSREAPDRNEDGPDEDRRRYPPADGGDSDGD